MTRLALLVSAAVLGIAAASPLAAQQQPAPASKPSLDSTVATAGAVTAAAADSAMRDLGRAVAVLAQTVQQTVTETANKPEVRLAAVQAAGQAVALAQQALTENVTDIERLLAEATRAIAELEAAQKAKVAKP